MHILAITYAFVPLRFPATFRLLKWCTGLTELGHDVTIVSVHPDSFDGAKQESLRELVPARVRQIQVRSPENSLVYRAMRKRSSWFYKYLEPRKMEWYRASVRATMELDRSAYDVIFSCSQPPVCHLVGHALAQRGKKPWVAFFSDPWVDNPMDHTKNPRIRAHNEKLEARIVHGADTLLFPSFELARQVARRYPSDVGTKSHVLPHCYVPQWYQRGQDRVPNDDFVHFLCAGNFYRSRTPLPLFEAIQALEPRTTTKRFRIDFIGSMAPEYAAMLQESALAAVTKFCGAVDYLESLAMMRRADYLILVDAPLGSTRESMFLPSKLIDYLGAQRPVLGLTPLAGAAARVLAETGNVACALDDPSSLALVLQRILNGTSETSPNTTAIENYHYRHVTRILADILAGEMPSAGLRV